MLSYTQLKGETKMGIVKVSNKVFGISVDNMLVPGGPVKAKTTQGDLSNIKFSEFENKEKNGRIL